MNERYPTEPLDRLGQLEHSNMRGEIRRAIRVARVHGALGVLLLALALYLALALTNLHLPGAHYDETADAVPAMELLNGQYPASALKSVSMFGQPIPIMMLHYIGPTSIYTSLLGFAVLGVSIESLRLTQTVIGIATLILLWLLARAWFDDLTAALAVVLAGTSPVFVWWNRTGVFFASPVLPLALAVLLLLTAWRRTGGRVFLIAACFVFGLGATTKLLFFWLSVPLALTAVLTTGWRSALRAVRVLPITTLALCIAAFCVGFAPFIVHNIPGLDAFRFVVENAARSRLYGHDNLDFFNNLRFEATEFFRLMSGDTLEFSAPPALPLIGVALIACMLYTATWLIHRRAPVPTRTARLFLLISILTLVPLGTFSVTAIGGRHLFILLPLAYLLMAACLADGLRAAFAERSRAWLKVAAVMLPVVLVANQLLVNAALHHFFTQTGGRGLWSDSITRTAELLQSQFDGRPVIAMDWGFERNVALITQGRVRMREAYEYSPAPSSQFDDVSMMLLREPDNVYLFHAPATTAFRGHWEAFERAAHKSHQQLVLEAVLRERDGVTNTLIYTARPASRSFTVPSSLQRRDATFDNGLVLLGGDVRYDPAKREVAVHLHWQSQADQLADDTVLLHIVDQSTGQVVVVADKQPVYGSYPFDRWQRGEVVHDAHWVTLPEALGPGVYQVRVGVYDRQTGARRAIDDPLNDAAGDSLMLHTFEVR